MKPYYNKWISCKKCPRLICKDLHSNDPQENPEGYSFSSNAERGITFLLDGAEYEIEVPCLFLKKYFVLHLLNKDNIVIAEYRFRTLLNLLNAVLSNKIKNFNLQMEDAIKLTKFRNMIRRNK